MQRRHQKLTEETPSPFMTGSRNAPLTIGFVNHAEIKALRVVDERCAAFFALGIAQQIQKPVAIVCTSGSALLNYYPAIAEAFYSNIPLVVISADRPAHLIDIGDGQTIRQENVFANHILFSANLQERVTSESENLELVSEALQIALFKKGPVHINVPFDEPLYETVKELKKVKLINVSSSAVERSPIDYREFAKIWNTSSKKLIVVGSHFPDADLQAVLNDLVNDASVLLLTETSSNLHSKKCINAIDQLIFSLDDAQLKEFQPDILITFGGMVVSKKIKQVLRKYPPKHHWHVDALKTMDTYHCLTEFAQQKPTDFLLQLQTEAKEVYSDYQQKWLSEKEKRAQKHERYLQEIAHSDLKVFEQVLECIPKGSQLQLSNSSVVRYAQLFDVDQSLRVFCNRGTSGIDGSTSTAIGAALASEKQTVFITGDLSFFYDSNALWNAYIPKHFRIIIINNSGGGIFRFIPGPKSTNALEYFETPHQLTAAQLSEMYHFEYVPVSDGTQLQTALTTFYWASEQPKILEVFTDKEINEKVLKEYFNFLKE
ncbi:MAG: 2-succinyl-5-enolpyruvyl-6-hydroxy-3-cyclohexene-1-carboxylic-acid synthase [Polaribacter sp.]|nr:2-succinyl-5-enolpyruvyl-6-hydroxy-3-cyclohexene-1-carboxylic-acid synthase [Polaribacter sp.]